jgi:hypothetical protein
MKIYNEELPDLYVLFAKYNWNDQSREDEMGRACSTSREDEDEE